jgi:O-antigen/teichoic acid export membrane protein
MSEDVRTITRGTGFLLPASLAGSALLLVLDQYVNGVLSTGDYGLFNAIKRVLQIATFVVLLGMENTVVRFIAVAKAPREAQAAVRQAFRTTIAASLVAMLAMIALAGPFAAWVDPSPDTADALRIGALSLPFAAIRMVAVTASQGWKVVTHRAIVMFLAWPLVQFVGIAVLAQALGFGIRGAVGAYVVAMALGAGLSLVFLLRLRRDAFAAVPAGVTAAALLAFAWPMWAQGIIMAAYTWLDQVLLAGIRSTTDAGVYGPVATLAPLFGVGLGALNGIFAPIIAERRNAGDMAGLERLYRTVTRWAVALAVPPLVVCAVAPETVLALWPNGSALAAPALRVTCFAQLVCTGVGSVNYLLIMAGHQRATLWNGIPAVFLNLGLSFALMPHYGVTGAAIANGVAMMAANGIGLLQVWLALRIHPFDRAFVRPLVAGLPTALFVWGAVHLPGPPLVQVAAAGLGGGVVFLAALRLLGLDADDRVVVDAIARKLRR